MDFEKYWNYVVLSYSITDIQFVNIPVAGEVGSTTLEIIQDNTGGHSVDGAFLTSEGAGLNISLSPNAVSLVTFYTRTNGSTVFAVSEGKAFI